MHHLPACTWQLPGCLNQVIRLREPVRKPAAHLFSLSALIKSATWLSHSAAGVFGRGEYAAVFTRSNPTSRTSASVRKYCSSVSPVRKMQQPMPEDTAHLP